MTLVRRLARPLLAASFVAAGVDAVLHPMPKAEAARPLVDRWAPTLGLPADAEFAVRANGALQAGAGVLFALGRLPRLSALVLATTLVPSLAEGAFWREKDPQIRQDQRRQLLRNASLLGGALLGSVDTEGRPGLAWRSRSAVRKAEKAGRRAARDAKQAKAGTRKALKTATNALPL